MTSLRRSAKRWRDFGWSIRILIRRYPNGNSGIHVESPPIAGAGASSFMATCTLLIAVVPNAPRSEVVGWLGDALKVKVHAPPIEGRANAALCEFLAEALGLPRRAVTLLRGATSRQKQVRIEGLSLEAVKAKLPA